MLSEEMLEAAARRASEQLAQQLPSELPAHPFAEDFLASVMRQKQVRHPSWRRNLRRAAGILLACFVGLSACLMGVEAWRAQLVQMVEEKFPDHSRITFEAKGERPPEGAFVHYAPGWLPDGFVRTMFISDDHHVVGEYEDGRGNSFSYHQMQVSGTAIALNTEGVQFEPVKVAGHPAQFLSNLGHQSLLWNDDHFCFLLMTNLSREQLLAVAEGITLGAPLEQAPSGYDLQMARDLGEVLFTPQGVEDAEQLEQFVAQAAAGESAELFIGQFFAQGWQRMHLVSGSEGLSYRCDARENPDSDLQTVAEWRLDQITIQRMADGKNRLLFHTMHSDEPMEIAVYE